MRRGLLDDIAKLNEIKLQRVRRPRDRHAHRPVRDGLSMQASVPELTDLSKEPAARPRDVRPATCSEQGTFAYNCLMARRLVERGVRFVQLMHAGWDQHSSLHDRAVHPVPRHRPALRRAGQGPEAARPARRHAGHLGRRVRPHAVHPGQHRRPQALGPRPSSLRLHHLDGRRRRQARHHLRRVRRPGHERRSTTRSTSTTSRRRCCTCSASTTSD